MSEDPRARFNIPANGRRVNIGGAPCLIIHGTVSQGPPHLQGRSLDSVLTSPPPRADALTLHPIRPARDAQGRVWYQVLRPAGAPGADSQPSLRFQELETAACTQHYLDSGHDNYRWAEEAGPGGGPGRVAVYARHTAPAAFAAGPVRPSHHLLAHAPAAGAGRGVLESHWRAIIKGELHDRLVHVPYYPRLPSGMGLPEGSGPASPGQPGTAGVGPTPAAQQAAAGAGAQSPAGGGPTP